MYTYTYVYIPWTHNFLSDVLDGVALGGHDVRGLHPNKNNNNNSNSNNNNSNSNSNSNNDNNSTSNSNNNNPEWRQVVEGEDGGLKGYSVKLHLGCGHMGSTLMGPLQK